MKNHSEVNLQPRLDPFVFPSETTLRFVLLIVLAISASLYVYNLLYWQYRITQVDVGSFVKNLEEVCRSQVDPNSLTEAAKTFIKCMEPNFRESAKSSWFAVVVGVGILLSLAGLFYSLFPALIIWKERLISLEAKAGMEDILIYLRDLCKEMNVRPPRFLQEPTSRAIGGWAFGALGRYYVVLPTGLLTLFDPPDQEKFRAVMLHELSHLRNKDVDKTCFSVAIGCAFVIATLMPYAFFLVSRPSSELFQAVWKVITLTLMVYLTFTSIMRSRELYADVRASTYPDSEALASLSQTAPQSKFSGLRSIMISTLERLPYFKRNHWQFAFSYHPSASERRQILKTTDCLFSFDIWAAFSIGVVVAVAYESFPIWTGLFAQHQTVETVDITHASYLIVGFIFALLIVGTIGIGVWRSTFVALMHNQHSAEVGKLGLWLGLGMILGRGLSLKNALGYSDHNLILSLFWDIFLLVSLYYFFKWMAAGAFTWLRVAVSAHSPHLFYIAGLIVAVFCLTVWFWFFLSSQMFLVRMPNSLAGSLDGFTGLLPSLISLFLLFPPFLVALISLWAFPLSACLWHKQQPDLTFLPRWGFLDHMFVQTHQPTQKKLEVYPALRAGLMGGLIYCGLLLVLRLGIRAFLPESVRNSEGFGFLLLDLGYLGLAVLMQAGIAIKVSRKVQSLNKSHGLFAAFIGGCLMAVSALVIYFLFSGTINAQYIWYIFSQTINWGALLSLLGMMMVRSPKDQTSISTQT